MDIALALVAALLYALGTVLQQRAGMDEPGGGSDSGLLLRMARRPIWLAGVAAAALGFAAQAIALSIGRLAIVQPVLVSSVVFALPLGAWLTRQRVRAADIGAAVLVVGALIAFLTIADPSGGRDDAPLGDWLIAGAVSAAICGPLFLAARRAAPARRAALLGIAAGVLFGLTAALTKAVTDQLADDVLGVLTHWQLYALIGVGYVGLTLNQMALSTGMLAPAIATSMAFDPIASVVLGVTLLEESIHESAIGVIATVAALAAALAGIAILSRSQSGPQALQPPSGAAVGAR